MCTLFEIEGDTVLVHSQPLGQLIRSCNFYCEFMCCGYNSCAFSHQNMIENFFSNPRVKSQYPDQDSLIDLLLLQVETLQNDFGTDGSIQHGYEHEDCSDVFWPGHSIDKLASALTSCLKVIANKTVVDPNYSTTNHEFESIYTLENEP